MSDECRVFADRIVAASIDFNHKKDCPKMNKIFPIVVLLVASTGQLNADVVSYSVNLSGSDAPYSEEVALPLFDPMMGILTEVSFEIQGGGFVEFEVADDLADDGGFVSAFIFGEFTALVGPGSIGNTFEFGGGEEYPGTGSFFAQVDGFGGDTSNDVDTVTMFVAGMPGEMFMTEVAFDVFDAFADDGDDVFATAGFVDGGIVTVSYTFTAVPEPGSIFVLGLFAVGLCQVRRRARV